MLRFQIRYDLSENVLLLDARTDGPWWTVKSYPHSRQLFTALLLWSQRAQDFDASRLYREMLIMDIAPGEAVASTCEIFQCAPGSFEQS